MPPSIDESSRRGSTADDGGKTKPTPYRLVKKFALDHTAVKISYFGVRHQSPSLITS